MQGTKFTWGHRTVVDAPFFYHFKLSNIFFRSFMNFSLAIEAISIRSAVRTFRRLENYLILFQAFLLLLGIFVGNICSSQVCAASGVFFCVEMYGIRRYNAFNYFFFRMLFLHLTAFFFVRILHENFIRHRLNESAWASWQWNESGWI